MSSTVHRMTDRGLIRPPHWLPANVQYEAVMGSIAYGVETDRSDIDIYGWAIPPKDDVFPHLRGEIPGFGNQTDRFEQYEAHHVRDPDAGRQYDFTVFGIVKFFRLAMDNNPNVLDALFVPADCVRHCTKVGALVRENRRKFLHRGAWPKFKGYAYAQLHKLATKTATGRRAELVKKHGYDTKFAYHIVRLLGEAEQILRDGDLDLRRDAERLKAVRRGEWPEARLRRWAADQEPILERAYAASPLPAGPDEAGLKELLLRCLEEHYGSLSGCVVRPDRAAAALRNIQTELDRVRDLL